MVFHGTGLVKVAGGDHDRVRAVAACKDTMLQGWTDSEAGYAMAAVDQNGNKPWNLAAAPTGGYTFRIAVDGNRAEAVKGDLKLSIGNFKDKPAAVLYRKVWDHKKRESSLQV